jgi:hypothetical protein
MAVGGDCRQAFRSYHHVAFVQARPSPRMRAASPLLFDILSLLFCLIVPWQLTDLVI